SFELDQAAYGNILCDNEYNVVISDLGISKLSTEASVDENGYYGIIPYIAPEVLQGQKSNKYTKASDIYSFGMIMWELMTGRRPFWDQNYDIELIIKICDGIRPTINTNAPEGYIELIQKCWHSDPNKRPTTGVIRESIINSPDIGSVSIPAESTRSVTSRSIFGKRKFDDILIEDEENTKKVKFNENNRK
ncbi:15076_t:CDS:2, partial [Funneliformis geosporum]